MEEAARADEDAGAEVSFRRLTVADLPKLHRWLNEPGVGRWWEGDDVSWDGVVRDYGPGNADPTEHWIAFVDGHDIGWIQCYRVADSPEELAQWNPLGVRPSAAGTDYLDRRPVGARPRAGRYDDPSLRHRGGLWVPPGLGPGLRRPVLRQPSLVACLGQGRLSPAGHR